MNSISDFIKNSARKFPEKIALISSNRKFSYKELEDEISSFSSSLLEYPKNSVISMFFENSADFIISYFGILNSACVAHIILLSTSNAFQYLLITLGPFIQITP